MPYKSREARNAARRRRYHAGGQAKAKARCKRRREANPDRWRAPARKNTAKWREANPSQGVQVAQETQSLVTHT